MRVQNMSRKLFLETADNAGNAQEKVISDLTEGHIKFNAPTATLQIQRDAQCRKI